MFHTYPDYKLEGLWEICCATSETRTSSRYQGCEKPQPAYTRAAARSPATGGSLGLYQPPRNFASAFSADLTPSMKTCAQQNTLIFAFCHLAGVAAWLYCMLGS